MRFRFNDTKNHEIPWCTLKCNCRWWWPTINGRRSSCREDFYVYEPNFYLWSSFVYRLVKLILKTYVNHSHGISPLRQYICNRYSTVQVHMVKKRNQWVKDVDGFNSHNSSQFWHGIRKNCGFICIINLILSFRSSVSKRESLIIKKKNYIIKKVTSVTHTKFSWFYRIKKTKL